MLEIKLVFCGKELKIFEIDASIKDKDEILQAINGERWYNGTEIVFDGLKYRP